MHLNVCKLTSRHILVRLISVRLSFQLLYQWTWVTLRRGTHKTPRSLRPVRSLSDPQVFILFMFLSSLLHSGPFYSISLQSTNKRSTQAGDICPPSVQKASVFSAHGPASGLTGCRVFMLYVCQSRLSPFSYSSGLFFLFLLRFGFIIVHFFSAEMTNEKGKEQLRCLNCFWTDSTQTFSKNGMLNLSKTRCSS